MFPPSVFSLAFRRDSHKYTQNLSDLRPDSEAIPEENYSKSLPERDKHGPRRGPALIKASGTPKSASNRKSTNPQTTALLSSSSTDSEEEEEEDEDCADEQHPI